MPDAVPDPPDRLELHAGPQRLAALTWGPPDGPLALLLHGFPDTAWTWRHLGPTLAAHGYRVVAPFTRGYAPSAPAHDGRYDAGALVADALAVHRTLGADERAVLVGHDWGALTAYGVARHAPGTFRRTVALAVPPAPALVRALRADLLLRQLVLSRYVGEALAPGWGERRLSAGVAGLWGRWSPGYDASVDLAHLADTLPDRAHWTAALGYYRATAAPWSATTGPYAAAHRACLAASGATLFLYGDTDGCVLPELLARAARHVPAAQLVRGTGHFLHLEAPGAVASAVRSYLDT